VQSFYSGQYPLPLPSGNGSGIALMIGFALSLQSVRPLKQTAWRILLSYPSLRGWGTRPRQSAKMWDRPFALSPSRALCISFTSERIISNFKRISNGSKPLSSCSKRIGNGSRRISNGSKGMSTDSKSINNSSEYLSNDSKGINNSSESLSSGSKRLNSNSEERNGRF